MVYQERNVLTGLVVTLVGLAVYAWMVVSRAGDGPVTAVDWGPVMLPTVVAMVVATIVVSIGWGIVVGRKDREAASATDERDREIARKGDFFGGSVLSAAGIAVIILAAVDADTFWLANVMFLGFCLSHVVGCITRLALYRRGL